MNFIGLPRDAIKNKSLLFRKGKLNFSLWLTNQEQVPRVIRTGWSIGQSDQTCGMYE